MRELEEISNVLIFRIEELKDELIIAINEGTLTAYTHKELITFFNSLREELTRYLGSEHSPFWNPFYSANSLVKEYDISQTHSGAVQTRLVAAVEKQGILINESHEKPNLKESQSGFILASHCPICRKLLANEEEIVRCPLCAHPFHELHYIQAIAISGKCPICLHKLLGNSKEIFVTKNSFHTIL